MKHKYFLPVFLVLLVNSPAFSQPPGHIPAPIINKGILKIEPATLVYFGDEYTNEGTHDNEGELYLNHHFINDGTTSTPTSGTTFFSSSLNDTLNISGITGSINFYNLEVNVTGVDIKGVSVLDNFGVFVVNQVNLVSGDLRLVDQAQLIQTHTGPDANPTSGSGNLLRDQQGISCVYGYNYWSSPVSNNLNSFSLNGGLFDGTDASLNPFTPQQVGFNTGSPYNGVPAVMDGDNVLTPLKINDYWLYAYSPNTSGYAGWEKINLNTALTPGTGFTMKGTGAVVNQNYVFKGLPNDGTYSFIINSGESALLGNPYPSALDAKKFVADNISILDKIQIWVDGGSPSHYLSSYLGGYAIVNETGGVGASVPSGISGLGTTTGLIPSANVAVAQGFFVEAISNGSITFDNSQRVFQIEDGTNSNFYKEVNTKKGNSQTDAADRFIRIGYEDPELFHRQLLLGFLPNSNANLNFNMGYDALMADPREDELFYIIENDLNKKYVIQGVGTYDNVYEFPIGLIITQAGSHTIMLDAVENFTDPVYIKDNVLNTTYNLSESNFSPNLSPGTYLDRFSIVFNNVTLSNADAFIENDLRVYYFDNNIIINNTNNLQLSHVEIFNELGQKLIALNTSELKQQKITIPFSHQKGLYIIKVESQLGKKGFKIIN